MTISDIELLKYLDNHDRFPSHADWNQIVQLSNKGYISGRGSTNRFAAWQLTHEGYMAIRENSLKGSFDPKKPYKTACGTEAKILEQDPENHHFYGWFKYPGDGTKIPCSWNKCGGLFFYAVTIGAYGKEEARKHFSLHNIFRIRAPQEIAHEIVEQGLNPEFMGGALQVNMKDLLEKAISGERNKWLAALARALPLDQHEKVMAKRAELD